MQILSESPVESVDAASSRGPDVSTAIHALEETVANHVSPLYWDWLRLLEEDAASCISQHPDHVIAELAAEEHKATRRATLVTCSQGTVLSGMAILIPKTIRTTTVGAFPPAWDLAGYRLAGSRFLGDQDEAVQRELLEAIAHLLRTEKRDFLLIEDLEDNCPLWQMANSLTQRGFHVDVPTKLQRRLRIHLPRSADEYWSKFSSSRHSTFRRKRKKIGQTELVQVTDVEQIPDFLEQAHRISLNSWQCRHLGLRVSNDHSELKLFTFLASQQALRTYLLFKDQQPIAFLIGTQFNGIFRYEEVGYDVEFAKLSPGLVLLLNVLEDMFAADTPDWFDFGGGDAEYKRVLATHTSRSGNVLLMPPGLRSRATIGFLRTCRAAKQTARWFLNQTGQMRKVRQFTRRGRSRNHS